MRVSISNNNNCKISVLLCTYNDERTIKKCISCILSQSFIDFEFIIINDGSNDKTREIIGQYSELDKRIRVFDQENKGLTKALNKGIRIAKGKYIARIYADDISYKERLYRQYNFLEKNENIVLVGAQRIINDNIDNLIKKDQLPLITNEIREKAMNRNPFFHSLVMFKRDIIEKVGYYDESFRYVQDYELWSRIIHDYETANLDEVLGEKNIEKSAISFRDDLSLQRSIYSLKARYRNFKRGNYSLLSIWCLFLPIYRVLRSLITHIKFKFYES